MRKNVVIIGQGEIGHAIKYLLKKTKHKVSIECWDVDMHACPIRKPLGEIIPKADLLFLCIPSWTIGGAAKDLKRHLKKRTVVVSVSKGLDRATGNTVDVVIKKAFSPAQPAVLLSGPMLAEEIMEGKPAAAVAASVSKKARRTVAELFKGTQLHIQETSDVRGVAVCGILKNIYSIGFGMAQAYSPGDNYRGLFVQETLDEMERIVAKLGGKRETVCTLAGVGDLIATGFSKHSKNHEYGKCLALRGRVPFDSEGSISIQPMARKIGLIKKDLKLFSKILSIIRGKSSPKTILDI
jgi:glycerol-3-phosphate dehydrogenase